MLFVLQEGIISPAQMGIVPSIEMVLWVAIGGRSTIGGAVLGALVTNAAKTTFSEAYPAWWPIMLGAMFIIVVLLLPKGIVGTITHYISNWKKTSLPKQISSSQEVIEYINSSYYETGKGNISMLGQLAKQQPTTDETILSVKGLEVNFDGFKALRNLDFSLKYGELRFLIGPNGAGKTTLLDVICGKVKPSQGHVLFQRFHRSHQAPRAPNCPAWHRT